MLMFLFKNTKYTYEITVRDVLIFIMLDTSQIATLFIPLSSHNFANNCEHASFNVDCCYDILQHLFRICMSTKSSVKFQGHSSHQIVNAPKKIRLLTIMSCL